jgi:tetratricopeptide (TPR) repeat protein
MRYIASNRIREEQKVRLSMARKKKPETSETATSLPVGSVEVVPIVTPEIADGYTGTVKRLICMGCQRVFYVTEADYRSLHPIQCHSCSTKLLAEYVAKKQQEKTEQEKKARGEIVRALVDDSLKTLTDTPEQTFVRAMVETNIKSDFKYGYKMLMCIPHHSEKGRSWDVTMTKQKEHPKASTHIRFFLIELSKTDEVGAYFYLPYDKTTYYETTVEEEIMKLDAAIERHPTEAIRYALKAEKLAEIGDTEQALQWFDKAITLSPSSSYTYSQEGALLERLERTGEAMQSYEKVISLEPDDVNGYAQKARLLDKLGREDEALALYDGFIAAHPTDLQGYVQKAMWYISHNQYEKAQEVST